VDMSYSILNILNVSLDIYWWSNNMWHDRLKKLY